MNEPQPAARTWAEVKRSWWPGWIWAVPIAALLVVGWLGFRALAQGGKTVTVTFDEAAGVRKNDTKVVYRGLTIGEVKTVALGPQGSNVVVTLKIDDEAKRFLRSGSRFWIIGAHPSLARLGELKDAITGPQIGLEPGPGAPADSFKGLELPPKDAPLGPQIPYRVYFDGPAGDLEPGAPVSLRGFRVGQVQKAALAYDAAAGRLTAVVDLALEPMRMGLASPAGGDWRAAADGMLDRLIRQGLRAELAQSPPLVGPRQVELAFAAGPGAEGLGAGGQRRVIPAAAGADLQGLERKADAILGKIDAVPITQIGDDVRAATRRLRRLLQSPSIDRTLNQVDDATAALDRAVREASPQIGPLVRKLRQTADDADDTVGAARKVIGGDPTSQDGDLPSALRQLSNAARAFRALADELERRPESLLRGKPKEGR